MHRASEVGSSTISAVGRAAQAATPAAKHAPTPEEALESLARRRQCGLGDEQARHPEDQRRGLCPRGRVRVAGGRRQESGQLEVGQGQATRRRGDRDLRRRQTAGHQGGQAVAPRTRWPRARHRARRRHRRDARADEPGRNRPAHHGVQSAEQDRQGVQGRRLFPLRSAVSRHGEVQSPIPRWRRASSAPRAGWTSSSITRATPPSRCKARA